MDESLRLRHSSIVLAELLLALNCRSEGILGSASQPMPGWPLIERGAQGELAAALPFTFGLPRNVGVLSRSSADLTGETHASLVSWRCWIGQTLVAAPGRDQPSDRSAMAAHGAPEALGRPAFT